MASSSVLLDHIVLEVRDPEASARFYKSLLGLAPVRLKEYRAGQVPFVSARINATSLVDFFPPAMWRKRRLAQNPNHFCLTMSERGAAALKRKLARARIKITSRLPRSFGAQGYGNSVYFNDPDGVSVEVRFYAASKAGRRQRA
jgi:catechol 2,3-dioxygenase-like lactoylglutathione lyase family enzyme